MDTKTIISALRCSSAPKPKCKGDSCPYFQKCDMDELRAFNEKHGVEFPAEFMEGCDVDRIAIDAADLLEKLTMDNPAKGVHPTPIPMGKSRM